MQIYYNQEKYLEVEDGITVTKLIESLKLQREGVAVAVNDCVVKKIDYDTLSLQEHDSVDIFNMVSGG